MTISTSIPMPLQLPDGALSNARDPPRPDSPGVTGEAFGRNIDRISNFGHFNHTSQNPFKFLPCDRAGEASSFPTRTQSLIEPGQASRNGILPTPSIPTRRRTGSSLEPLEDPGRGVPVLDLAEGYGSGHARSRHVAVPVAVQIARPGPAVVSSFRNARDQDVAFNAVNAQFRRDMAAGSLGVPAGTTLRDVLYAEAPAVQPGVRHLHAEFVDRGPLRAANAQFRRDVAAGLLPEGTTRREALAVVRNSLISGVIVRRNGETGVPYTVYPTAKPFH